MSCLYSPKTGWVSTYSPI